MTKRLNADELEARKRSRKKKAEHRAAAESYHFGENYRMVLPSLDDYDRSPDSDRWDRLGDHRPTMSL